MSVVDRGTSILVSTAATEHYTAETALLAVAQLLLICGLPNKLRFDNDPRFVGNWPPTASLHHSCAFYSA